MENKNSRHILIEQIRQQSIQKRTQVLKEAVQKQAMNAPIAGASSSGGGGGSSSSFPDRVDLFIVGGSKEPEGFVCNTKDMYNDGDTPIYYGTISFGGVPTNVYIYWNGVNWGLDNDLNPPYQAIGPTTKNNLYGTYDGGGAPQPNIEAKVYSQAPSLECIALPGGETTSSILPSGIVTWAWDGIPTSIGGNQWTANGIVSGLILNNSVETTLTGDFLIGYDGISDWSLRNNGPMTLGPFTVSVLSIPTGTVTGAGPDVTLNGSFDTGTISGTVIYNT